LIRVSLRRDASGRVQELACRGHARFSQPGQDLVCAGVSAVLGALGLGLTEVARLPVSLQAGDGLFVVRRPARWHDSAWDLLLETTVRALQDLERHYPGFVRLRRLKPRGIRATDVEDQPTD
jgi:hypothetical protein